MKKAHVYIDWVYALPGLTATEYCREFEKEQKLEKSRYRPASVLRELQRAVEKGKLRRKKMKSAQRPSVKAWMFFPPSAVL